MSLATFSKLNQAKQEETEVNDGLIPGTFGGEGVGLLNQNKIDDSNMQRSSIAGSNSNSYYQKGVPASTSITDGMLSFNPSNLNKVS